MLEWEGGAQAGSISLDTLCSLRAENELLILRRGGRTWHFRAATGGPSIEAWNIAIVAAINTERRIRLERDAADATAPAPAPEKEACTFWFVRADVLRGAHREECMPPLQELLENRRDWMVQHHIELFNGLQGTYVGEFLFVSHRWEKQESPDPKCAQLHAVQAHLRQNPQIKYVWFDFWCMPQHWCVPYRAENGRTADEQSDFERMLPNIPLLCLGCSVLIILDLAYISRFWTQFEAYHSAL